MTEVRRFTREDVINTVYYQLPKFLFGIKGLSNNAKILYALLKERHELSFKNGWVNDKGEIYLVLKREDMQEMLGLSDKTTANAVKELKIHNLLQEERLGQGKPNRIYLLQISGAENYRTQTRKITESKSVESAVPSISKKKKNKTELSNARAENEKSSFDIDVIEEIIRKK